MGQVGLAFLHIFGNFFMASFVKKCSALDGPVGPVFWAGLQKTQSNLTCFYVFGLVGGAAQFAALIELMPQNLAILFKSVGV